MRTPLEQKKDFKANDNDQDKPTDNEADTRTNSAVSRDSDVDRDLDSKSADLLHHLLPGTASQQELYLLWALLRQLIYVGPTAATLLDPHDLLEAVSCHRWDRNARDAVEVVQRLRKQLGTRILAPFVWDSHLILGLVSRDQEEFLLISSHPNLTESDKMDLDDLLTMFVDVVFPDQDVDNWDLAEIRQSAIQVTFNCDSGCFQANDAVEQRWPLKDLQALFLDAVQIISNVERQEIQNQLITSMLSSRILFAFAPELVESRHVEILNSLDSQTQGAFDQALVQVLVQEQRTMNKYIQNTLKNTKLEPSDIVFNEMFARQRMKLALQASLNRATATVVDHAYVCTIFEALWGFLWIAITKSAYLKLSDAMKRSIKPWATGELSRVAGVSQGGIFMDESISETLSGACKRLTMVKRETQQFLQQYRLVLNSVRGITSAIEHK